MFNNVKCFQPIYFSLSFLTHKSEVSSKFLVGVSSPPILLARLETTYQLLVQFGLSAAREFIMLQPWLATHAEQQYICT